MSNLHSAESHWNRLYENPRFRPVYPNDQVVRFLMASRGLLERQRPPRFLDIGIGAARHSKLASELGFEPYGIDLSFSGLQQAQRRLALSEISPRLAQTPMIQLPFADNSFDVVVSFGVFNYGTAAEMSQAIGKLIGC